VTVNYNLPDNITPYLYKAVSYTKQIALSDCIEEMPKQNKGYYLAQSEIKLFDGLDQHFNFDDLIPYYDRNNKNYINLWMGFKTRSGLHYDLDDNFLVQIFGTKKVFLVSPDDTKFIYPLPENFLKSMVNPSDPDFKRYPKFKHATILEGELGAGDVLFIPKGWFHYIYSPEQSISLNCWYGSPMTIRELIISYYRSGFKTWICFCRDFIWHGLLKRPFKERLFCSPPVGKLSYEWIAAKMYKYYLRIIRLFESRQNAT
jgi:lysine-specific demethylase 8